MKYTYLSTIYLPNSPQATWIETENSMQKVLDFLNPHKFRQALLRVEIEGTGSPFYIDAEQLLPLMVGFDNATIRSVFDKTYPAGVLVPITPPNTKALSYAQYYDAQRMNYIIRLDCYGPFTSSRPERPTAPVILNDTALEELPDILLANIRSDVDVARLHDTGITFVNGLAHITCAPIDFSERGRAGIYIKDGGRSHNVAGFSRVGVLDFDKVGKIKKFPLSLLTKTPVGDIDNFFDEVNITDIDIDITNFQVILSLGGFLLFPEDGVFVKTGAHSVRVNMTQINIEEKIVEAAKYINLASLGLESVIPNEQQEGPPVLLRTREVLEAFMNLSQSFLIVVPKPNFRLFETAYKNYGNPNGFTTKNRPELPIFANTGRLVNYWMIATQKSFDVFFSDLQNPVELTKTALYNRLVKAYPSLTADVSRIHQYFTALGYHAN